MKSLFRKSLDKPETVELATMGLSISETKMKKNSFSKTLHYKVA